MIKGKIDMFKRIYYLIDEEGIVSQVEDESWEEAIAYFQDNYYGDGRFTIRCEGEEREVLL